MVFSIKWNTTTMSMFERWEMDSEIEKKQTRLPVFVSITNSTSPERNIISDNLKNKIVSVLNADAKPFVPSNNE